MEKDGLKIIFDQVKKLGQEIEISSVIKSGKEATVYRVFLNGEIVAMKVYKNPEERDFKNTGRYLEGKNYLRLSHRKAVAKGNRFSKKLKYENWVKREFFLLEKLYQLGAKIPKPILQVENAIFMELLGDTENVAPRLCDVELTSKEAEKAFRSIIETVLIFWNFGIVHADLSEYNILWWNKEAYIIDFPQAVDKRTHPNPSELLERDLKNITRFFGKFIEVDFDEVRNKFV
ncbi:MAG: RIO1 family regulatory kinase/ATPase [Candidatus Uhrbacteria bacterium]